MRDTAAEWSSGEEKEKEGGEQLGDTVRPAAPPLLEAGHPRQVRGSGKASHDWVATNSSSVIVVFIYIHSTAIFAEQP